jgi:type IV secretion system protein VirD4
MSSRLLRLLAVLAVPLALAPGVLAQDTSYLSEMPSVNEVVKRTRGRSRLDTAARTSMTFTQLGTIIRMISGKAQQAPEEAAKIAEYESAAKTIEEAATAKVDWSCQGDDCDRYWLPRCVAAYMFSPQWRRELLDEYFSPRWQAQYSGRLNSGTAWQRGVKLPVGTKATAAQEECQAGQKPQGVSSSGGASTRPTGNPEPEFSLAAMLLALVSNVTGALSGLVLPVGFVVWVVYKVKHMRYLAIRASNRGAIGAFGKTDRDTREQVILDAFDSPDHTFRFEGVNRLAPHKMRFVLLRNIKSFRRGDLEAMRFAYLAFNRGLLDEEKFHMYRFSAIYGDGMTDPSEWKFLGLFGWLRRTHGQIAASREAVKQFAGVNAGPDIESLALAMVQKLGLDHPKDDLYKDLQRRFVEGVYWLTKGEMKRSVFAPSDSKYSLTFGRLDGTDSELVFAEEGSVMTIAPPGSGKTQCNVFPNLLRWPGPAFVLDVKGEIYDATSAWRAANVGPVIKFSPLDPARSDCYNPLTSVRTESFYLWEDARFLASMMIVPVAKEPFWEDKAREILTAIIADVAFWNPPKDRTMSKVLSLVNRNGWSEFVERLRKNPEISTMRDEGSNLAHMEPKTLDGALQTAKASLSAWVGERIAHVTKQSDWSPLDLRGGTNPTIYVCIKINELDAYLSLLRVVIAQHIRALTSTDIPPRGTPPILFLLDELPRLKYMPPVEEALEVGRAYGIKLWMFAQSLGQMKASYVNAEGMIGSCAVRTFMNPSLQDGTAKMLAEQIGFRKGEEHGGKGTVAGLVVEATQLAGAEYKDLQIVMGVGSKPAKVRKMFAYQDPAVVARMGALQQRRGEAATT